MIPSKEKNIEDLADIGFEIQPKKVEFPGLEGSTLLLKDDYAFYVGRGYVFGEAIWSQPIDDLRINEDEMYSLLLKSGLGLPKIERNTDDIVEYFIGYFHFDAKELYKKLKAIPELLSDIWQRTPSSPELTEDNQELMKARFKKRMQKVIVSPDLGTPMEPKIDVINLLGAYEQRDTEAAFNLARELRGFKEDIANGSYDSLSGRIDSITAFALILGFDADEVLYNLVS